MKISTFLILILTLLTHVNLHAGGISVDAGITPPQDRFILRTQYRYLSMDNSIMSVNTHMSPLVLAYGVTSGFTFLARAMYVHRTNETTSEVNNGMNDLYLLTKFKLYRKNTANYVFGIAPHIASNIPVGSTEVSNRSWNPELGLNISYRPRFFAVDVSASYLFSDVSGKLESNPGNIYSLNIAVSGLVPMKTKTSSAISPVIEMTYTAQAGSVALSKNDILFFSPGISFIYSNLTLEALVQIPAFQTKNTGIINQNSKLILGIKYLF